MFMFKKETHKFFAVYAKFGFNFEWYNESESKSKSKKLIVQLKGIRTEIFKDLWKNEIVKSWGMKRISIYLQGQNFILMRKKRSTSENCP